jgi:hypothetical protein
MPRKEFEAFTRLDASDVNTFLMDQSIMTFAGTAARGSAIPTPVEGMVSYLEDSNTFEYWDSDSWDTLVPEAAPISSGNAIINGAFDINQRNYSSGAVDLAYTVDRWRWLAFDGTITNSLESFTPGSGPASDIEARRFLRTTSSGQTAADAELRWEQSIEDVTLLAGKTLTVSFYAKVASGTPSVAVNLTQNFGTGGSPSSAVLNAAVQKIVLTGSTAWTRYSATVTMPSITGKTLGTSPNTSFSSLSLWFSAGSDENFRTDSLGIQSNTFDIWGVQVETGTVATPFRLNANSLQGELAACQRYYYRITADVLNSRFGNGHNLITTVGSILTFFPVTMRIPPTALEQTGTADNYQVQHANTAAICNAVPSFVTANTTNAITNLTVASGLTAGQGCNGRFATTTAFLGWGAEL